MPNCRRTARRCRKRPLEVLGPPVREQVIVEGRTFVIDRPGESDKLLDHPAVHAAFAADEYLPYWADLWPAARMLAKAILREPWAEHQARLGPLTALEIGCGLGLPGIAALSAGLAVTFSDYDATALRFAADNARANGFSTSRRSNSIWRYPPPTRYPVLLASDLIYEVRNVAPLVSLIQEGDAAGRLLPADRPGPRAVPRAARNADRGGDAVHDAGRCGPVNRAAGGSRVRCIGSEGDESPFCYNRRLFPPAE